MVEIMEPGKIVFRKKSKKTRFQSWQRKRFAKVWIKAKNSKLEKSADRKTADKNEGKFLIFKSKIERDIKYPEISHDNERCI